MPTELEREREVMAAERRAKDVAELARVTETNRLKQRSEARKSEVETAEAALVELKRRNAEEDAADKRISDATAAEDAKHAPPAVPSLPPVTKPKG